MIFTILYNNYKVINKSLARLRETDTLKLPIAAVDNGYPFLTKAQKTRLKNKYNLTIIGKKENRGLAGGYNELIAAYPDLKYAIFYDCDSLPESKGWDEALMETIKEPRLAYCSLMFDVAKREMQERGFTPWETSIGHVVWRPKQACVQSVSVADLDYLRKIGGLQEPRKYYGGLESFMFKYWNDEHQIGYIDGVYEKQNGSKDVDKIYTEYKWAYAHEGYDGSFNDFIKIYKINL